MCDSEAFNPSNWEMFQQFTKSRNPIASRYTDVRIRIKKEYRFVGPESFSDGEIIYELALPSLLLKE